jgi:hypothetical protein
MKQQQSHDKRARHTIKLLTIGGGILLLGWFLWQAYLYYNPYSRLTFQRYDPTYVVDNMRITDKSIEVWAPNPWLWFSPDKFFIRLSLDKKYGHFSERSRLLRRHKHEMRH